MSARTDDHHHVEDDRRQRGCCKPVKGIQDAGEKRHQRHAGEIGKCDPRQQDGEIEFLRIRQKPRRKHHNQQRHDDFSQRGNGDERPEECRQYFAGEFSRAVFPAFFYRPGEKRHEGRVERPFRE